MEEETSLDAKCRIAEWLKEVIETGSWKRFDDLHIDVIYDSKEIPTWEWLTKGLESLQIAQEMLTKYESDFYVFLGLSLKANKKFRGFNFASGRELTKHFNWTPPSLYLFDKEMMEEKMKNAVTAKSLSFIEGARIYGFEWSHTDYKHRDRGRSMFISIRR